MSLSSSIRGDWPSLLASKHPALTEDPQRDPVWCQQVVCLVGYAHNVFSPCVLLIFYLDLCYACEGRLVVGVLVASFLLVGCLVH